MRSPFALTPWIRGLLVAMGVVYLLSITVFTSPAFFQLFAFQPASADRQPWTFLTYLFMHAGFLHLAFNALILFFFGPAVEERMGSWAFARYFFLCSAGGAILSFLIGLVTPVAPFVGASAAAFGVALAFAWFWPDTPVYVFPLPVPIKVKWLVAVLAGLDLGFAMIGARDGVAHLAHLGGFLTGLAYFKTESLLAGRQRVAPPRRSEAKVLARPAGDVVRAHAEQRPSARARQDVMQREMDRVLDKISASGMGSLTAEERRFLAEFSRQMKRD